jgi:hypothetical protein
MIFTAIVIVLFTRPTFIDTRLNISFLNSPSSLRTCLFKMSDKYLNNGTIWLTSTEHTNTSLFRDEIFKNLILFGNSISITTTDFGKDIKSSTWLRTNNYVIETSDVTDLEGTIHNLKYLHSWNSNAKFFLIATNIYNETDKVLAGMVESLWFEGIYNFLLITPDRNVSNVINFYTWYPYRCKRGVDFSKLRLLDTCSNGHFQNNSNLFPAKIPKKLRFCKLHVGAVIWPPYVMSPSKRVANTDHYVLDEGIEVRLIRAIAAQLRLNVSYTVSEKPLNWGDLFDNGTATGLMALLRGKKIDIAIASLRPSTQKVQYFEVSDSYFFESFSWCVPHATTQPSWRKVLDAISYQIWIVFCLSFLAESVVVWLLSKKTQKETYYKNYINCLLNLFSMALGVSTRHHPKTQILRWICCFWILFCLNFGVLYETQLFSVLTKPVYDNQIKSIGEIMENNLQMLFVPNVLSYMEKNYSLNRELYKNSVDCTDMNACLSQVAYDKDGAVCVSTSYTDYIKDSYVTQENIPLIHCFHSDIVTYPVILLMKKGFPLKLRFNKIISQLVAGGFIDFWAEEVFTHKWKLEELAKLNTTNTTELLGIEQLKSAFICLLIGLLVATIVFVGEIIYYVFKLIKGKHIFIV